MSKPLNGASTVNEDGKMKENILRAIAHYTPFPLYVIEQIFHETKSYDATIAALTEMETKRKVRS